MESGADSLGRRIARKDHKVVVTNLEGLDEKLEQLSNTQKELVTEIQDTAESRFQTTSSALMEIQSDLKLGWLQKLGTEVKGMVFQIFTMSGTTLDAVQRIEQRLPTRSEQLLIRTFILEDVLGKITLVDMDVSIAPFNTLHLHVTLKGAQYIIPLLLE